MGPVIDTWDGTLPVGERLVVVAPHPDDEILAAGGLLRWWSSTGRQAVVVAVTDGEASHSRSSIIGADELRRRRGRERREALDALCPRRPVVTRLRHSDQGCAASISQLVGDLRRVLTDDDVVVGPALEDRHPDHVAVAMALRDVVAVDGGVLWEAPTWALVHGSAPPADAVLTFGPDTWERKKRAMAAYRSQLVALGPDRADGPVVHPHELRQMLRPCEQFRRIAS